MPLDAVATARLGGPLVALVVVLLAEYLVLAIPVSLLWLWFTDRAAKLDAGLVFVAVVVSLAVSYGLGLLYAHPAPYQIEAHPLLSGPPENAFPSQHVTVALAMAPALYAVGRRRLAGAFVVVAALVAVARVAAGLHAPVDVLGSVLAVGIGVPAVWLLRAPVRRLVALAVRVEDRLWRLVPGRA